MKKLLLKAKAFLLGPEIKPFDELAPAPDYEAQTAQMLSNLETAFDEAIDRQKRKYVEAINELHFIGVHVTAARAKLDKIMIDGSITDYPELYDAHKLLTTAISIITRDNQEAHK